jgi:hypothetical protein
MIAKRLRQQIFGLMLVGLLLAGCGGTPAEPTATPTPTLVPPTATPEITAKQMNEPVEGDEWEITVVSATNQGKEYRAATPGLGGTQTFSVEQPGNHLIEVEVHLKNLTGAEIGDSYKNDDVKVMDGTGAEYSWIATGPIPGLFYVKQEGVQNVVSITGSETTALRPLYVFTVPDDATDLYFVWPNLAPVLLEIE